MQTFLVTDNLAENAKYLDTARLGKQRVECLQIMKALSDSNYGWQNHPAVYMWRGLEWDLYFYTKAVCDEWITRGYKDTCWDKFSKVFWEKRFDSYNDSMRVTTRQISPLWSGDEEFFNSHKSNLLRKNPDHYKQFGWEVEDNLDYKWFKITKK
jgi:hypothetical protein